MLLISLYSVSSYNQNLSLDQILKLRTQNVASVEEFLSSHDWNFLEANEPENDKLGSATFTYNKGNYDDKAESFFIYAYSNTTGRNRVSLQILKNEIYNSYLNRIKSLGCKLLKSEVKDGDINKIYKGSTTTFIVKISTNKENDASKTMYYFLILDNEDYILNYN